MTTNLNYNSYTTMEYQQTCWDVMCNNKRYLMWRQKEIVGDVAIFRTDQEDSCCEFWKNYEEISLLIQAHLQKYPQISQFLKKLKLPLMVWHFFSEKLLFKSQTNYSLILFKIENIENKNISPFVFYLIFLIGNSLLLFNSFFF